MHKNKKYRKTEVNHQNAAGIDIGSGIHYACVPEGRSNQRVQKFKCYTSSIYEMVKWFKDCGIDTVAMESTGAYWVPSYQILEKEGFAVYLVNA